MKKRAAEKERWEERLEGRLVERGSLGWVPTEVRLWVAETADILAPRCLWISDGSEEEGRLLHHRLRHTLHPLPNSPNTFLARTHPHDTLDDQANSFIVTPERHSTETPIEPQPALPSPSLGELNDSISPDLSTLPTMASDSPISPGSSYLAQWLSPEAGVSAVEERFPGAMRGRVLYVVPFSLGPMRGPNSVPAVQLTDSPYVVLLLRLLTRVGPGALVSGRPFARCVHTLGVPLPPTQQPFHHSPTWDENPDRRILLTWPMERSVWSFGRGYGILHKSLALQVASWQAREEGWFAAHMAVFSLTRESDNVTRNFGAAFPSGCGKTSLALMKASKPGFRLRCLGDDIAWLRWDTKTGRLCATCPENGIFGHLSGINHRTHPLIMDMLSKGALISNVAETANGDYLWDGLEGGYEKMEQTLTVRDWRNNVRPLRNQPGTPYAHPDARFAVPLSGCPTRIPQLEADSPGLPLDAILFGSRRPNTFPLIYEASHLNSRDGHVKEDKDCTPWLRGTYIGASLRSASSAPDIFSDPTKSLRQEPFAMRPFISYNLGQLCTDWMELGTGERVKMEAGVRAVPPRVYHVNWWREDEKSGALLWPGFGENVRVLEWVMRRLDEGEGMAGLESETGKASLLGIVPCPGALDISGLSPPVNWEALMEQTWTELAEEATEVEAFFRQTGGPSFPYRHLSLLPYRQLSIPVEPRVHLHHLGISESLYSASDMSPFSTTPIQLPSPNPTSPTNLPPPTSISSIPSTRLEE